MSVALQSDMLIQRHQLLWIVRHRDWIYSQRFGLERRVCRKHRRPHWRCIVCDLFDLVADLAEQPERLTLYGWNRERLLPRGQLFLLRQVVEVVLRQSTIIWHDQGLENLLLDLIRTFLQSGADDALNFVIRLEASSSSTEEGLTT